MLNQEQPASIGQFVSILSDEEKQKLLEISEIMTFANKSIILKSGIRTKKAFLVLEGSVRGYVLDSSGQEVNILLRSKGIFVADAEAIFGDQPQKLNIVSMDRTKVLMFSIVDFERLAHKYQGIQTLYTNSLKEAILRLSYRVNSMITMTSEERYLDLLDMNPDFLKDAYDKYVANYLGITAVSFSRIKKKLNNSTT